MDRGRFADIDDVHPGPAARVLCRMFRPEAAFVTPYGTQLAIEDARLPRIALAVVVGMAGRAIGRRGDFHRLAGRQVAWIDAIAGTMGPYS